LKEKKQTSQYISIYLLTGLDQIVYKLYNLTPEEIEIIEGYKINNIFGY